MNPLERMARFLHPSGRGLVEEEAKSILDRVFPPEQCDDEYAERVLRMYLANEDRRRRQWPEMYEDEGEVA